MTSTVDSSQTPMGHRRCRGFNRNEHFEPTDSFASNRAARDGYQKLCRACQKAAMAVSREKWRSTPAETKALLRTATKACRRCTKVGRGAIRPISDFYAANDTRDGKRNHCKDCVKELRWKRYGIKNMTVERYASLLRKQGGTCAIPSCGMTGTEDRVLDVDHDHETGEVRGLLCKSCNTILGRGRETPAILAELIDYLKRGSLVAA